MKQNISIVSGNIVVTAENNLHDGYITKPKKPKGKYFFLDCIANKFSFLLLTSKHITYHKISSIQAAAVKVLSISQCYKTFSCLTQLSTKFFLLINVEMPTIVGI